MLYFKEYETSNRVNKTPTSTGVCLYVSYLLYYFLLIRHMENEKHLNINMTLNNYDNQLFNINHNLY